MSSQSRLETTSGNTTSSSNNSGGQSPQKIALAKPYFDGSEMAGIQEALNSGWVTQGPQILKFEQAVAEYVGAQHAIATSNCTTAMHLGWLISGIGAGDDVICPSYSFIASANAIRHAGATPVFADIDENTLNIDVNSARRCIEDNYDGQLRNKKTGNKLKAILVVHQIGIPADIDAFDTLCKEFGIRLVEDAACAIGSSYKKQIIGGSGNICAFSFHPRKVVSTGEGGMLTLKETELADKARVYRAHGMSVSDLERHKSASTTFESYEVIGYNYRMTDIQAAIGISQIKLLEGIIDKRVQIAKKFNDAFNSESGLLPVTPPSYVSRWNYQSYHLRLEKLGLEQRNKMMQYLEQKGVSTRRGIPPIHKEPVYASGGYKLPVTERVSESSFFIPIFPQLTDIEVEYIIESVLAGYASIK